MLSAYLFPSCQYLWCSTNDVLLWLGLHAHVIFVREEICWEYNRTNTVSEKWVVRPTLSPSRLEEQSNYLCNGQHNWLNICSCKWKCGNSGNEMKNFSVYCFMSGGFVLSTPFGTRYAMGSSLSFCWTYYGTMAIFCIKREGFREDNGACALRGWEQ